MTTPKKPLTENSRVWMTGTTRQIITNLTIAGLRVYRGEIIREADWTAILTVNQREEVNQILNDSARRVRYVEKDNHNHPR